MPRDKSREAQDPNIPLKGIPLITSLRPMSLYLLRFNPQAAMPQASA